MANVFVRFDLLHEAGTKTIATAKDESLKQIIQCVIDGDSDNIESLVSSALQNHDPLDIINEALIKGMNDVSQLWDEGTYYLPQVIVASDAMLAGIDVCEKKMGKAMDKKGIVITHTAEGDIHDLGQKIANALLKANGFEVIDLGKDVPVDKVVEAVKKYKPVMIGGTALMTTTMTAFERISRRLSDAGITVPFVCGGGAVSLEYVSQINMGVYGQDASQAPTMATDAVNGLSWEDIREKYYG